jgi:hypothetical protein
MGWNYGNPIHGTLTLDSLASNQTYTLAITYKDGHQTIKTGVPVRPNETTVLSV